MTAPAPAPVDAQEAGLLQAAETARHTSLLARAAGAQRQHDPFKRVHPERDLLFAAAEFAGAAFLTLASGGLLAPLLAYPAVGVRAYRKSNREPENEKWRNQRFRALHPRRSYAATRAGKKTYRKDEYTSIWQSLKERADRKVAEHLAHSGNPQKMRHLWRFYEYSWLLTKVGTFGANWYLLRAAARRLPFAIKHFGGLRQAGRDARNVHAEMFYQDAKVPEKNFGLRNALRQIRQMGQEKVAEATDQPEAPQPEAPEPEAQAPQAEAPDAATEEPTVELNGTPAEPEVTEPAAAAEPEAGKVPWKSLTPEQLHAIRSDIAKRRFERVNAAHAEEYTRVLNEVADLDPVEGPKKARQLAQEVLETERVAGFKHQNPLMPRDKRTLELLSSVHQIATADKGTKLSTIKELARATVDGRPTPEQLGVTLNAVRRVELAQVRAQRAAGGGGLTL
jgi:hypothetical protein